MKCKYCDGTGKIINDALRWTSCPVCGGKGFVEMTNEEWFCQLSTEEKAKVFANATYSTAEAPLSVLVCGKEAEQKKWEMWLKAPHDWKLWLKQPHKE